MAVSLEATFVLRICKQGFTRIRLSVVLNVCCTGGALRGFPLSLARTLEMPLKPWKCSRTLMENCRSGMSTPNNLSSVADMIVSLNPGRIQPTHPAWEDTRKPMAAAWQTASGDRFYTVNVHLRSKRDSSSAHGDARPPVNGHSDGRALQVNVTAVSRYNSRILRIGH